MVIFFWSVRMNEHKEIVADWITRCSDMVGEIVYLLDKAYPNGAEDRFYHDWEDEIALEQEKNSESK